MNSIDPAPPSVKGEPPPTGKAALYANPARKPVVLTVKPVGIPDELVRAERWLLWKLVFKGGRWTKVPVRPDGLPAKSNDPATWSEFAEVLEAYRRGGFDGIGFVLGDGFAGVDLDDVRDAATGELVPWADELVADAATFADVSPSGTGVKLFGRGVWRGDWHNRPYPSGSGSIEVYDGGRFFAVTGHRQGVTG